MIQSPPKNTDVITILELVGYVTRRRENVTISRRHRHDHHQPPRSCAPLVFVRGVGAVYVFDQSGDEANLINQMVSDRSKTGGYGYRTSRATFGPEGLKS
ncbi:hypothetical protein YC2023_108772 [Brassica napus]